MAVKKIMLAEDDPFLIDIYSLKLKVAGFDVAVVADGEKVVEAVRDQRPDVLLLDIVLPHCEGWSILTRLKEDYPANKTKIIVLSNLGQRAEVEKGLSLGADKYLVKAQFTPSEVVEEVKKLLS
ncbi:MAG: response regulator [Patescibacteria group bacterium]|nr:response regulator [Patescibacteria group bacterium]